VFSSTFHDDFVLGNHWDDCNATLCACRESWAEQASRFAGSVRAAATLIVAVASAGSQVAYLSLFPRAKELHGAADVLRAHADDTMHNELRRAGFYARGGRFVDVWPLAASYFELTKGSRYAAGPSSLHYSPISVGDRFVEPDFVAMRLQLLLHALCHDRIEAAAQPEPQSAKDSAKAGERRGQSASDRADGWEDGAWREAVVETAQPGFEARVRTRYVPPCGIGTLFMEQVAHTLIVVLVVPE